MNMIVSLCNQMSSSHLEEESILNSVGSRSDVEVLVIVDRDEGVVNNSEIVEFDIECLDFVFGHAVVVLSGFVHEEVTEFLADNHGIWRVVRVDGFKPFELIFLRMELTHVNGDFLAFKGCNEGGAAVVD